MADTDPVSVTVEIVDNFSDDIEQLRAQLESLEKDVGVTLEIDDNGDIDWAKSELEGLEEALKPILKVNTADVKKARAELETLDNTVTSSTHNVDVHRDGDQFDPPSSWTDANIGGITDTEDIGIDRRFDRNWGKGSKLHGLGDRPWDTDFNINDQAAQTIRQLTDADVSLDGKAPNIRSFDGEDVARRKFRNSDFGLGNLESETLRSFMPGRDSLDGRSAHMSRSVDITAEKFKAKNFEMPGNTGQLMESLGFDAPMSQADLHNRDVPGTGGKGAPASGIFGRFGKSFQKNLGTGGDGSFMGNLMKKIKPSMRKWTNLLAVLLPMIISLAAAVGGLIAALGAVAVAGVAAFGVGAWGVENLQEKIKNLKSDIKDVFEPASEAFAPFVEKFMDLAPGRLQPLVDAVMSLQGFEGILSGAFTGGVEWVSKAITEMSKFKDEIDAILGTVGSAFGNSIINFMEFLVRTTAENRKQFLKLASILGSIAAIIFNLSTIVSFAVANFEWLFEAVAVITNLLNNNFVVALLTTMAYGLGLYKVLQSIAWLAGGSLVTSLAKAMAGLTNFITYLSVATGLSWSLAAALTAATAGLAAVGGAIAFKHMQEQSATSGPTVSSGPSPASTGRGGGDMYVNIEGNADKDALNKLNDKFDSKWDTYSGRDDFRSGK